MNIRQLSLTILIAASALSLSAQEHLKSLNPEHFDTTVSPGADFYHYVNGGWQAANPLTPEYARYGKFNILSDTSQVRVQNIVLNLADSNPEAGTTAYNVATLYTLAMDSTRRNAEGASPIAADIARIRNTPSDRASMVDLFLWMHANYGSPLISASPMEDMTNSDVYAMYIGGASLGMGDRDYYLLNDSRSRQVRDAYKRLIVDQMVNAGLSKSQANKVMKSVMKIETLLADSAWTREQSRDIQAMYNPYTRQQLAQAYPALDWDRFFTKTMGIEHPEQVIVTEEGPLAQGCYLLANAKPEDLRNYYLWQYVEQASPFLGDNFADAAFEFSRVESGVQQQRPRWKRALGAVEGTMGEAVGQLYVERYFPESSKQYMLTLVENLRTALGKHIIELPWMTTETKYEALKKLNAFTVKIGYPDKWETYEGLVIDPALSYYDNMHNVFMWHQRKMLSKWGKPVDKTEWGMTPQTVNAYYNPLANEIVFPAGILQAPFFDPEASDAENYGGIGVVIGHEMTHGFDDQGRHFDANGNMNGWWTEADAQAFDALTQGLVAQFDQVEVLPGLMANGTYTLGENIADQGGLRIAMTAFLDAQKRRGVDVTSPDALIDGLTPEQAFYMNYANLWAQNVRDEEMRSLTIGDVHSLGINRVNVTLRNLDPFFRAFSITEADPMFRPAADRVIIW